MKSLRTYNMEDSAIRILKSKQNKSQFVNLAVHKLHSQITEVTPADFTTKQLLAAYLARLDMDDPIRGLILMRIKAEL